MGKVYYYHRTIYHNGLNKSKTIAAVNKRELNYKIELQEKQWDEQWKRKLLSEQNKLIAEQKREERAKKALNDEQSKNYADSLTKDAEEKQNEINNILNNTIKIFPKNPDALKDYSKFSKNKPNEPDYIKPNIEPKREDAAFNPQPSFLTKLSSKKLEAFNKENDDNFTQAHWLWQQDTEKKNKENLNKLEAYKKEVEKWEKEKIDFENEQKEQNDSIDQLIDDISKGEEEAVSEYVSIVLNELVFPLDYNISFDVEYNSNNKSLIVDANFPTIENIPNLKSVSYIKSKQEFKETYFSDAQLKKIYDNCIYQMVLAYLDYLFKINNYYNIIENIVLNGIVDTIDKSTGLDTSICILSVRIKYEDFKMLNLSAIDPKTWFRSSKGIAAANISNITPIQPVQTINKEDKRFVEGYNVADGLDLGDNLAAIDWQDFENLIREVFNEEFNVFGGEVKITQASRDGGVDAIAFDNDPIRGGKIVIQAKRYTNVVGVSAVRDLYGTVINEGAMKGILVTTSYYGNDAYEFAKDKPIQLIDGAGLLGLMDRHGHKARIDLKEAKKILNEK